MQFQQTHFAAASDNSKPLCLIEDSAEQITAGQVSNLTAEFITNSYPHVNCLACLAFLSTMTISLPNKPTFLNPLILSGTPDKNPILTIEFQGYTICLNDIQRRIVLACIGKPVVADELMTAISCKISEMFSDKQIQKDALLYIINQVLEYDLSKRYSKF